ncbi:MULTISPECIES: ABC transporter ATP-binding protein [unclassified Micromonospora]|uniref:ABC transporter ATP-binding protein n=1 Tax=unclassified Micromonospora TaxID=2617518 RepID=UPI0033DBD371
MGSEVLQPDRTVLLTNVSKYFVSGDVHTTALDNVSLRVDGGTSLAVTGASGSGKSTLLHLIGGIEKASAGTIQVGTRQLAALRASELVRHRRSVGFVFQRFNLLPALTAAENVMVPLYGTGLKAARRRSLAFEALEQVGLCERAGALPSQLSGGQQQRVAIARAIVTDPSVILADEPTGNLDSASGAMILELLTRTCHERQVTLLIVTHDHEIARSCAQVIRMADGAVLTAPSPD